MTFKNFEFLVNFVGECIGVLISETCSFEDVSEDESNSHSDGEESQIFHNARSLLGFKVETLGLERLERFATQEI